ncbi:TPA: luciferase, partial [Vibrio parahaemolyticus]|nr:luciferase [Vibrio parahaemolyticus]
QAAKQMMRQLGRIRAEYEAGQIAAPTEKTNS